MAEKQTAVFGMYERQLDVERAIDILKVEGFGANDISVLFPDNRTTRTFAHEKETKAPEGATTGAGAGVVIGGTLGWLVGIGSLAIPGVGPFIAAGPIMAALAGAGVGGVVGGIGGALVGLGFPEYEAKLYAGYVADGGILLSVHCTNHDQIKKAQKVLEMTDAKDISKSSETSVPKHSKSEPHREASHF